MGCLQLCAVAEARLMGEHQSQGVSFESQEGWDSDVSSENVDIADGSVRLWRLRGCASTQAKHRKLGEA